MAQRSFPSSVMGQGSRALAAVLLLPLLHCLTACSPSAVDAGRTGRGVHIDRG